MKVIPSAQQRPTRSSYIAALRVEARARVPVALAGVPFVIVLGLAAGAAGARAAGSATGPAMGSSAAAFVLLLLASHAVDAMAAAGLSVARRADWHAAVSLVIDAVA